MKGEGRAVRTRSPQETRRLGELLGSLVARPTLIWLAGDLGAGKTCFTQGLGQGLGVPAEEPVTSPSYTLMNHYQGRLPLYHFDLYRLSHPDDLEDLGFAEYLDGDGVTVVEWADRFDDRQREGLTIRISRVDEHTRHIDLLPGAEDEALLVEELLRNWHKEIPS